MADGTTKNATRGSAALSRARSRSNAAASAPESRDISGSSAAETVIAEKADWQHVDGLSHSAAASPRPRRR